MTAEIRNQRTRKQNWEWKAGVEQRLKIKRKKLKIENMSNRITNVNKRDS